MTDDELNNILAEIKQLEAERAADLAGFLGNKGPNGAKWDGVGVNAAKKLQETLGRNPSPEHHAKWQAAWAKVSSLTAG
jgi:hypothetical protein